MKMCSCHKLELTSGEPVTTTNNGLHQSKFLSAFEGYKAAAVASQLNAALTTHVLCKTLYSQLFLTVIYHTLWYFYLLQKFAVLNADVKFV